MGKWRWIFCSLQNCDTETLQKYPITKAVFEISLYQKTLDDEDLRNFKFPTLRYCYIGGEPVSKEVIHKWREYTGVELWNTYAQTEVVRCLNRQHQ